MKKLWFMLRCAFHDWMWDPSGPRPRVRAVCQRLPRHFSDPHMPSKREFDRLMEHGEPVQITTAPGLRITSASGYMTVNPATFTSSSSSTTFRWKDAS